MGRDQADIGPGLGGRSPGAVKAVQGIAAACGDLVLGRREEEDPQVSGCGGLAHGEGDGGLPVEVGPGQRRVIVVTQQSPGEAQFAQDLDTGVAVLDRHQHRGVRQPAAGHPPQPTDAVAVSHQQHVVPVHTGGIGDVDREPPVDRPVRPGHARRGQREHPGPRAAQRTGTRARVVSELLDRGLHRAPGVLGDLARPAQDVRHGARRDACPLGDVLDRGHLHLHPARVGARRLCRVIESIR